MSKISKGSNTEIYHDYLRSNQPFASLSMEPQSFLPSVFLKNTGIDMDHDIDISGDFYNAFTRIKMAGTKEAVDGITFYNSEGEEVQEGEDGGWRLYEDRKGKPGWISEKANTTIIFNVIFKDHFTLDIGFLRSYEGIGKVAVSVLKPGETWAPELVLNGHIEEHFSQVHIELLCVGCKAFTGAISDDIFEKGWGLREGPAEIRIRNMEDKKFKIVFVIPFR